MIEVVRHIQDEEGFSVLVKDLDINMDFWVDVWNDGDLRYNWNQYIFWLLNSDDVFRRDYQNNIDNFDACMDAAVDYLQKLELIC